MTTPTDDARNQASEVPMHEHVERFRQMLLEDDSRLIVEGYLWGANFGSPDVKAAIAAAIQPAAIAPTDDAHREVLAEEFELVGWSDWARCIRQPNPKFTYPAVKAALAAMSRFSRVPGKEEIERALHKARGYSDWDSEKIYAARGSAVSADIVADIERDTAAVLALRSPADDGWRTMETAPKAIVSSALMSTRKVESEVMPPATGQDSSSRSTNPISETTPQPSSDAAGAKSWSETDAIIDRAVDAIGSLAAKAELHRANADDLTAKVERLTADRDEGVRENMKYRAIIAQANIACVYCHLPAEDWSKCAHGFPGCSRADDASGCRAIGVAHEMQARAERAEAALATAKATEREECARIAERYLYRSGTVAEDIAAAIRAKGGECG